MMGRHLAATALIAVPALMAHAGKALEPHELWSAWSVDPGILVPLVLSAILYTRGARISRGVAMREAAYFWTGWIALALALVSPLHLLGEVLFSAHMVQHEILMLAAAPLLVLSRPTVPMLWGLPMTWRKSLGKWSKRDGTQCLWCAVTQPWLTWWVHAAALWIWHIPALFQATLTNAWVHAAQHLSFLGSALLFWWSLFYARGRSGFGSGMLYVFTTAVHTSVLGALLTLSPTLWYPAYAGMWIWGVMPLQDQQLGGLIMWIPAGVVYLGAGLGLFAMWLREGEAMSRRSGYAQ